MSSPVMSRQGVVIGALLVIAWLGDVSSQQAPPRFGSTYEALDDRRKRLIDDWVSRFMKTTGQSIATGPFYDEVIDLSTKTTFDAVTHALMTTRLTDRSGASMGDALDLVDRVNTVRGEVPGARGDAQFRMFARLTARAVDILSRSREFKRGADNSVFHKGYPTNYRESGGVPSIQISITRDGIRADIDVDYRTATFPLSLVNGHLTASNSDVRAGNNYDKHLNRWTGLQNWWRSFFGVRQDRPPDAAADSTSKVILPRTPRAGQKSIDVMVHDFLTAWLVEGNAVAAMGYVSDRAYACLAQDSDNPSEFDRGMAPFQLLINLKSAYESVGPHSSLNGLIVGTRYTKPGLRAIQQPHHAQFVVYSVPDDIAASFDCGSRLMLGDPKNVARIYGHYYASTFHVGGRRDVPVALLWANESGYWKIVSWQTGTEDGTTTPAPERVPDAKVAHVRADPSLVDAARSFLDRWVIRKDYDAAFAYLSPQSYGCYDLERSQKDSASTSPDDAARKLRAALETSGQAVASDQQLESVIEAAQPLHSAIRVMDHPYAKVFSLTSLPNALADTAECAARANASAVPDPIPLEYGNGFGMTLRFKTRSGDAPVLRLLWRKENRAWRITSYAVELP